MNAQKNGFGVIIAAAGMAAVQTPAGNLAAGKAGARNAAILAARIPAPGDPAVAERAEAFKQNGYRI